MSTHRDADQDVHDELHRELMAAFAHEVAHHDCGHLKLFRGWLDLLPRGSAGSLAAALFRHMEHRLYGPERETEADLHAVELCLEAGYDGALCLQALEILENSSLDRGDIDGVYGPENLLDPTDPGHGGTAYALQRWLWIHMRRYLPLRERRERAWAWYRERLAGRGRR